MYSRFSIFFFSPFPINSFKYLLLNLCLAFKKILISVSLHIDGLGHSPSIEAGGRAQCTITYRIKSPAYAGCTNKPILNNVHDNLMFFTRLFVSSIVFIMAFLFIILFS